MTRLIIQPLTRVEGHGRVELGLRDGQLHQVKIDLCESPRLFEQMVLGRSALEVPDLVCRVCAICSAVHRLAALAAIEQALAVDIPPAARLLRELLLLGGHIQSHALHLFCLILPDLAGSDSLVELLRRGDPLARAGLAIKAYGNLLQEVAGGRVIHPVNAIPGGISLLPPAERIAALRQETDHWLKEWPGVATRFAATGSYPPVSPVAGTALATGTGERLSLVGNRLFLGDGHSSPADDYAALLAEKPVSYSRAKHAAGSRGPFLVGALARHRLFGEACDRALPDSPGIHANNAAQLLEINHALHRVAEVLAELTGIAGDDARCNVPVVARAGRGVALLEAPRGLLVHNYLLDDRGHVVAADIVTPTSINQRAMEVQLFADLVGVSDEGTLRLSAERIIRAYDPCISCAVHVIRG